MTTAGTSHFPPSQPRDFSFACLSEGIETEIEGALSACRAGYMGLVDLSANADSRQKEAGLRHLERLFASCAHGGVCGARIEAAQLPAWAELTTFLRNRAPIRILVKEWQDPTASDLLAELAKARQIYLEASTLEEIADPRARAFPGAGWAARAATSNQDFASPFILLQSLARQDRPFLSMEMEGPGAIAAAKIAGAAGVVARESVLRADRSSPGGANRSIARALHRLRESAENICSVAQTGIFAPGNPLAQDHGTEFPIVQGPMTRVSDSAEFACAVAANGALPILALALHSAPECFELMTRTRDLAGGKPWGVGLLGFAPRELLEEQMTCVKQLRPPFCVLSGGRPDQVARLEKEGTATYLHVPVPELIEPYFKRGVRRFVFEGSECGGHTGPHHSFGLWGEATDVLTTLSAQELRETSVLFAGGIHDALSAAMASAFAARVAALGTKAGVLMGTAYLFTREIVDSGAVVPAFQAEALRCRSTARITTGRGHVIRCAPTPFVEEFSNQRKGLEEAQLSPREVAERLEALTLGRARAASRGLWRNGNGAVSSLSDLDQQRLGMYMMGEVAAFRDRVLTLAELHREVCQPGSAPAVQVGHSLQSSGVNVNAEPIAIVGMSGLVPGASTLDGFWRLLLDGVSPIAEIPKSRFDWQIFFDENSNAKDKIYSRWGGFIDEVPFDPILFGIPPRSLGSISPLQLLSLEVARRALADAGYEDAISGTAAFDRKNTSLCLGVSGGADLQQMYIVRSSLPMYASGDCSGANRQLPEWTEESFPGNLLNVIAGRIANRFDLGGSNRTIDAACASSLAALQISVADLQSGRANVAISGGIDLDQTPYTYMAFSKTHALSPRGVSLPFDQKADGIVLSEGLVLFVLKRLSDAEREGDRIYALIRSVEGSSDGRGKSLTAPQSSGQRRALDRAYAAAGIHPATLGLYEAHGTGTAVGDRSELETILKTLEDAGAVPGACAIGSAKGLLGHTKSAAGAVGLMKAAMALYHRVLPPLHSLSEPLDPLLKPGSPLCSYDKPTPWLARNGPRRAGVSAFGFGGTNFHATLEEYEPVPGAAGANAWPCELFLLTAPDAGGLGGAIEAMARRIEDRPLEPLARLSLSYCQAAAESAASAIRLALVARDRQHLRDLLSQAKLLLAGGMTEHHSLDLHLQDKRARTVGDVAFLFPGQGSQYVGMGRELALYAPELRAALEHGDRAAERLGTGPLSQTILAPNAFGKQRMERQAAALNATEVAQPALGVLSCGLLDFARRLGIQPAACAGHSYGELVALHAAGVLSREDLLHLSFERGRAMRDANRLSPGAMAAVNCRHGDLSALLPLNDDLTIANFNSPGQCVLSGTVDAIEAAIALLRSHSVGVKRLAVGAAFHSRAMAPAALAFAAAIDNVRVSPPALPVYSNFEGRAYPAEEREIRAWMKEHLCRPVHFEAQIRALHQAGARTFVEVGAREVLSGLVASILEGCPHQALSLDGGGGGMRGALNSLATLWSWGVPCELGQLFAKRTVRPEDESRAAAPAEWFVNGGSVRRSGEKPGILPVETSVAMDAGRSLPHVNPSAGGGSEEPAAEAGELLHAYTEYQQTMRGLIDSQERILFALLNRREGGGQLAEKAASIEQASRPVAPSEPVQLPAVLVPEPSAEISTPPDLTATVIAAISKRTGYPPEFIKLDYDIEADIGVDSLKRIDILLEIEGRMPAYAAQSFEARMNDLAQFRTVRSLVGTLEGILQSSAPSQPESPEPLEEAWHGNSATPEGTSDRSFTGDLETCPRFAMRWEIRPAGRAKSGPFSGLCLVAEDDLGVAGFVAAMLAGRGFRVETLSQKDLSSSSRVEARVAPLRERHGPAAAIVYLAGLGARRPADDAAWELQTQVQLKSLFQLTQDCARTIEQGLAATCTIIAATGFGGMWGREHAVQSSYLAAGMHGMLRTAHVEHPQLSTAVVDFDPDLPPERIAEALAAELLAEERDFEIGYRGRDRFVFSPRSAPLPRAAGGAGWFPEAGSVVVLTGGARGITAQIAEEFARPGVHLVLLGRGRVRDSGAEVETVEAIRDRVVREELAAGQLPKPAKLEARVREEAHRNERTDTIDRLRSRGADVSYLEVDVLDPAALRLCLQSLYKRFGRIDAVAHGAGVLDDGRMLRKSLASFDRVFHTKTKALRVFEEELEPDSLRLLLLFSSVSGRFGNGGQADYAAANEVLARWAWLTQDRWPNARTLAVCWGPWMGVGMAADGVLRGLREKDILSIDPSDARRFLRRELASGERGCEIIAGDGFWNPAHAQRRTREASRSEADEPTGETQRVAMR